MSQIFDVLVVSVKVKVKVKVKVMLSLLGGDMERRRGDFWVIFAG